MAFRKVPVFSIIFSSISILVSISFEKSGHLVLALEAVGGGEVRIDLAHGIVVSPAAEFHRLLFRQAEVER